MGFKFVNINEKDNVIVNTVHNSIFWKSYIYILPIGITNMLHVSEGLFNLSYFIPLGLFACLFSVYLLCNPV